MTLKCRADMTLTFVVPGYATSTTNNLRLWSSKASTGEFDFQKFNNGEYEASVNDQQRAETISAVLYPNDKYAPGILPIDHSISDFPLASSAARS